MGARGSQHLRSHEKRASPRIQGVVSPSQKNRGWLERQSARGYAYFNISVGLEGGRKGGREGGEGGREGGIGRREQAREGAREGGHTCNAGGVSAELSDGEGAVVVESAGGPEQVHR